MSEKFQKLMREQLQEALNDFLILTKKSVPKKGWIRTIREALGISSYVLAKKLGCSRSNITTIEQREKKGTITLETLNEVARSLNCKLVYCLVPLEPIDKIVENQARKIAKKRVKVINYSMQLEQQGLKPKQLKQQEDDLTQELLQGNLKDLWVDDEV